MPEYIIHDGGESTCPSTPGTELVYTGVTGGSWYSDPGGAANYICMPLDPEYTTQYRSGTQHYNKVWGTEYKDPLRNGYNNVNVPVCSLFCFNSSLYNDDTSQDIMSISMEKGVLWLPHVSISW